VLHVLDGSEALTEADKKHLAEFETKKRVLVRNKIDLPARLDLPAGEKAAVVEVCCLSGKGIEPLKDAIKELVWAGEIRAEMLQVMINSRHQGRAGAGARGHGADHRSVNGQSNFGTGSDGFADCDQRGGGNRGQNHDRRLVGFDFQPVLHWEVIGKSLWVGVNFQTRWNLFVTNSWSTDNIHCAEVVARN